VIHFLQSDEFFHPPVCCPAAFSWVFQLVFSLILFEKARCLRCAQISCKPCVLIKDNLLAQTRFTTSLTIPSFVLTYLCIRPDKWLLLFATIQLSQTRVISYLSLLSSFIFPHCVTGTLCLSWCPLTYIFQSNFWLFLFSDRCVYLHLQMIQCVSYIFPLRKSFVRLKVVSLIMICSRLSLGVVHWVSVFALLIDRPNCLPYVSVLLNSDCKLTSRKPRIPTQLQFCTI